MSASYAPLAGVVAAYSVTVTVCVEPIKVIKDLLLLVLALLPLVVPPPDPLKRDSREQGGVVCAW